jgi:outer membrane protein assembly factor BamD (BamD/ComL family)
MSSSGSNDCWRPTPETPGALRLHFCGSSSCSLIFVLALIVSTAGCPKQPPEGPVTGPASDEQVEMVQEPAVGDLLRQLNDQLNKGQLEPAKFTLTRLLTNHPSHLEARVLQAMLHRANGDRSGETKAWIRVEQVLIYKGKTMPFEVQATLYEAARQYLRVQNRGRARLFLDELWRRFPDGPWAVKAQLLVAEIATSNRRWSEVLQACQVLSRIRPRDPANRRCVGLSRAARRMLQVGPKPANDAQRWSWEHPLPQGNSLNDVWVNPGKKNLVIAVGEAGTILQAGRAGRFKAVASPTRWALNAITGGTINAIYAVGAAGVVVHYDGAKWSVVRPASPGQPDLWGAHSGGPGRLVAVGDGGAVVTLSGGRWTRSKAATVTLRAVWGAEGELFAVGEGGMLLRNSGRGWRLIRSDSYEDLWGIWGTSAGNVIAVGNRKTVVHYNGKKAKEAVVGRHHFRDTWGTSAEEAWAVGTKGEIISYSRGSWRGERSGCLVDLFGVAGRSSRSLWAVGDGGTILRRRGKRWSLVAGGLQQKLVAVIPGPTVGEGHALGERGALMRRNRKGRWKVVDSLPLLGRYRDVWSDGRRWIAVGDRGLMVLKTGRKWAQIKTETPEDLRAVWGWDGGAVAVGTRGTVIRLTGSKATRQLTPTGLDLRDVWGTGPRSLVAVGHRGIVLRFDGERWTEQRTGVLDDLRAVWSDAAGTIWAVGSAGVIINHAVGQNWKRHISPISQTLVGIWGNTTGSLFAVSERGAIIGYDSGAWKVQNSPASCLTAINGDPATGVLAVGCNGTVLRWTP